MFVKEPRELFKDIPIYYRDLMTPMNQLLIPAVALHKMTPLNNLLIPLVALHKPTPLNQLLILLDSLYKPTPHLFFCLCWVFIEPVIF